MRTQCNDFVFDLPKHQIFWNYFGQATLIPILCQIKAILILILQYLQIRPQRITGLHYRISELLNYGQFFMEVKNAIKYIFVIMQGIVFGNPFVLIERLFYLINWESLHSRFTHFCFKSLHSLAFKSNVNRSIDLFQPSSHITPVTRGSQFGQTSKTRSAAHHVRNEQMKFSIIKLTITS